MKRLIIGDLHGNFSLIPYLKKRYADYDEIVVAGDFGLGFHRDDEARMYAEDETKPIIRFIRGNHDNVEVCKTFTEGGVRWIPDGTVEDGILYVGGAWSIDYQMRTPGLNWWYNEELSEEEWEEIFKSLEGRYEEIHTVVSHDLPQRIAHKILPAHKPVLPTRTTAYLDMLWNRLPNVKLWLFGHYHVYQQVEHYDVTLICLPDRVGRTYTLT